MCYIYKITNLTENKIYIGQTRLTVQKRWERHIKSAEEEKNNNKKMSLFHQKINEYGANDFIVEQLEECSEDELNEREQYWISFYDSYNNGYNTSLIKYTPPLKDSIIIQYKDGRIFNVYNNFKDAENNIKIKASNIRKACNNSNRSSGGYKWKTIDYNELTEILNNTDYNLLDDTEVIDNKGWLKKSVKQYDLCGNFIKEYSSLKEAEEATGISWKNISRSAKIEGKSKSGGYQWRFSTSADIPEDISKPIKEIKENKKIKPVIQFTKKTHVLIKEWDTIEEAAKALELRPSAIINVCEGSAKSTGNFYWQYKI